MQRVAWFEILVGHIPTNAELDSVQLEIRGVLPLQGVRYNEFRTLRRDLPQKWEVAIPSSTVYDGHQWALPEEFLRAEIERVINPHGIDVRDFERVSPNFYRATIVAPVWWKPPEPEEEEEPEPDY